LQGGKGKRFRRYLSGGVRKKRARKRCSAAGYTIIIIHAEHKRKGHFYSFRPKKRENWVHFSVAPPFFYRHPRVIDLLPVGGGAGRSCCDLWKRTADFHEKAVFFCEIFLAQRRFIAYTSTVKNGFQKEPGYPRSFRRKQP